MGQYTRFNEANQPLILQLIFIILFNAHNTNSKHWNVLAYIIAGGIGYLIGSFPTAYFLVKWKSNVDIRNAGSGNVGTLNSYEVTQSRVVGIIVLLVDLFKGVLAILVVKAVLGSEFIALACAGIGAVLGHNYPLWLGFKGGRGLATAAGVMLVLGWACVPFWCAAWVIGRKISNDVNVGNAVASLGVLLFVWLSSSDVLSKMISGDAPMMQFKIFATVLMVVILGRLVEPVREYLGKRIV